MTFFKGKKVLITGGAGFIGGALAKALEALEARVYILDLKTGHTVNTLTVVDTFFQSKPDIVFHLAAQTEVRRSFLESHLTYKTNVYGTLNVLEACREYKTPAVVVASTDKVYGNQSGTVYEGSPFFTPADTYSASKRLADEMAQDYGRQYGLPIRILRCANTYGPGQKNTTTLITNSINKLVKREVPVLYSDSVTAVREWLYIDDAVQAYLLLAKDAYERELPWHGNGSYAFNVGTGQRLANQTVIRNILQLWGMGQELSLIQDVNHKPQIEEQPALSVSKFRAAFPHWSPVVFMTGLMRTINWHKSEGVIL